MESGRRKSCPFLLNFWKKGIGWVLKGALGIITGFSIFQSLLTPVLDSVRKTGLQSLISALPGVGDVADSVIELTLGSAAGNQGRDWGISFAGAYGASVSASFKDCPDCGGSKGNGGFYGDCQRQAADGMREQNRGHGAAVISDGGGRQCFCFLFPLPF